MQSIKNIGHLFFAILANIFYGFPSRKLQLIGITGTDGKTTTANLIYHILSESGFNTSIISTVSAIISNKIYDTGYHVTTPSSFSIQRLIKRAVSRGSKYFILETTSHALDQYRVYGIKYDVSVITNITPEHLHYHKTYEQYVMSKIRLISWSKKTFINEDDGSYDMITRFYTSPKIATYGFINKPMQSQQLLNVKGLKLSSFNKYNYLAAYFVCKELGISDSLIYKNMLTFKLPAGRQEVIYNGEYRVIVDFAHTTNAVREVLSSIKKDYDKVGRLIHIFGAAAFRDDSKRAPMGRESATYSDLTIITEEDYRTEDPADIAKQIAKGLQEKGFEEENNKDFGKSNQKYTIILDRGKAIEKALSIAKRHDVIVITGKGHEMSLNRNGKEYHWNDKEKVNQLIASK